MSSKQHPSTKDIFSGPQVEIEVGNEGDVYCVSKTLLTFYSEYFRAAFDETRFVESIESKVKIQDISPCTFECFLRWMYEDQIPDEYDWFEGYDAGGLITNILELLAYLYVFADRFSVPILSRSVISATIACYRAGAVPHYTVVKYLFDNLPENDRYLKLLVDGYGIIWDHTDDDENEVKMRENMPIRFWILVAEKLSTHRGACTDELKDSDYLQEDPALKSNNNS